MQKNLFGKNKGIVSRLNILTNDESTQLMEVKGRRTNLIWDLWDLLGSNIPRLCHFVRVSVYKLSEKEFANKIGVKPVSLKKLEGGDTAHAEQVEVALMGFMNLYKADGDLEILADKVEILRNQATEDALQKQFVAEVIALIDSSSRDIGRFVRSLTHKYSLHKEEAGFVMDKTPEELEELLSGECADSRRLFGEIEYKIEDFAKRLATAIVDPMYEKNGSEGELASDAGSAEGLPTADIITKVVASIRNGEASPSQA